MTPAARVAAAIEVLDLWLSGQPAEKLLTTWGRQHRFAGSRDRAAIRDHVWQAIRCRRSFAALGGDETGRGLMLGALRAVGEDPGAVFTGEGHAPAPLTPEEATRGALPEGPEGPEGNVALDCPDWLAPALKASLGTGFAPVMQALRHRAPVFLRANLARTSRDAAVVSLAEEGIEARPHPLASTALEVIAGARRVQGSRAFRAGLVELQDAASQALVEALCAQAGAQVGSRAGAQGLGKGIRVLDHCAGGGGKTLALAATGAEVFAHDIDAGRMRDLPARAKRAGVAAKILAPGRARAAAPYDLVFADAPCSGSGAWRRSPEGKWRLTPRRLDELCALQRGILEEIHMMVAPGGGLAYATCSLLDAENNDQVAAFLARHPAWHLTFERRFTPLDGGDGFYVALMARS